MDKLRMQTASSDLRQQQKTYYLVSRDGSIAFDIAADNFDQIFVAYNPDTARKVL